ncbi:unnamed protein product [Brassica oleracea]
MLLHHIRNLDNTFVDHTSDYKTRLVYKDALKSISSKTGALFPRMNQFESQTSFLSGFMTQLSEQISSLNERMEEFTNRIEELNSKLSCNRNSPS